LEAAVEPTEWRERITAEAVARTGIDEAMIEWCSRQEAVAEHPSASICRFVERGRRIAESPGLPANMACLSQEAKDFDAGLTKESFREQ
jgi:hypothetical protein